jgi:hypothetical protein
MELVDVRYVGSSDQYQTYAPSDVALINTNTIVGNYGAPNDYIEYFIKDLNNTVLSANYYATQYQLNNSVVDPITRTTTQLYLDPEMDARSLGYDRGIVNVKYNFFAKQLASAPDPSVNFWIKEISTSRLEIKAARQDLSNTALQIAFTEFNTVLSADAYYPTFYLNFGADIQLIGINAVYVEEEGNGYVIFKLYEPLPTQFDLKSTFWVVTQVADSAEFNVAVNVAPETVIDSTQIKGPNFKVAIKDKVGQTTPYYSYESLLLTSVTSSYQQLSSMMQEKGIQINVDYSNFSNFVHFSSATERLHNFVYKIQLIESASAGLAQNNTDTAKVLLQNQIDSTITNFDGYEYYLYFTSESAAWPKQNSSQPYSLYSATSSQVVDWLGNPSIQGSKYQSASYYDDQNKDLLLYATPSYILDDAANAPYLVFLNMIGQHFDNIWIYLKDVTNHYSAENNPFVGISMDQVADALRSFGVQLYTNTSITDNIYYSLLGLNQTGSSLPVTSSAYSVVNIASSSLYPLTGQPWLTASLSLPPFGEEKINRYVTTFVTQSNPAFNISESFATLPASQITGETYKRLYHNLAYLLKTRGTERGIKALITTFGIPTDILTPHEYGGYNIYEVPGIQDISNTKIITGSVLQISSSLLNPYTTIQYYQNNADKSSNDIQVGFSPADSINASITSSVYVTSSTQPGYFNIMQLIGAPDLQYSSSYIPLVELANTYFSAEYTSRYNVWDFIRVIKYYNNSVFKMLRDWVPARSSASTGIVIQSHMLERNKYPRHEPTFTNLSASANFKMVSISGGDGGAIDKNAYYVEKIPVQYQSNSIYLGTASGDIYMSSSNNIQRYTGEFSGSTIITDYAYFPQEEVSSYIYPWTSSVAPSIAGANIMYSTYSVSPTLNNIFEPVQSQRFLDLDYNQSQVAPVNYGLITQSLSQSLVIGNISQSMQPYSQYAYIQDYNYNSRPIVTSRYSGSYLQCYAYNKYTSASIINNVSYSGDISYANNPVINYYSDKLGFFTQIQSSSFIPGAVNATLGYLSDVSGGLFELNQNNKHWVDVQNIFVQGTTLTVKQFDNKKYSNQVATDGVKTIYNSGYNYTPELYFTSSDEKIFFEYNGALTQQTLLVTNQSNYFISGTDAAPQYPLYAVSSTGLGQSTGYIYNIFDNVVTDTAGYYTVGNNTDPLFPSYTVPYAGYRKFVANLNVNVEFPTAGQEVTYSFTARAGSRVVGGPIVQSFGSVQTSGTQTYGQITCSRNISNIVTSSISPSSAVTNYGPFLVKTVGGGQSGPSNAGDFITTVYLDLLQYLDTGTGETITLNGVKVATAYSSGDPVLSNNIYKINDPSNPKTVTELGQITNYSIEPPTNVLTANLNLNLDTDLDNYIANEQVTFELQENVKTTATTFAGNYTASVSVGSLQVVESVVQGSYPFATNDSAPYISGFNNSGIYGYVTMSTDLSLFYGYQQVPYFVSGGVTYSSSLYDRYGDVNVAFIPEPYDKLILTDRNGIVQNLDVYSVSNLSNGQLIIQTIPTITTSWVTNPALVETFLLLRRYNDEQNVILTYTKPPGQTSYGFILPETVNPLVTANINTLQAKVQAQLLSTQASATINTV